MIHAHPRLTQEQIQRRKTRNRKIIVGFFVFLGVVIVLESPLTRVRGFVVSGNKSVPASKIIQDTDLHTGMSLWQVRPAAVQAKIIAKEPIVQSVQVHTDSVKGIVSLQIFEKHIVAIYETGGKFYNLLSDGEVYSEIQSTSGFTLPIITAKTVTQPSIGKVVNSDLATLCQQLSVTNPGSLSSISEIHVDTPNAAQVYLDNGFVALCPISQFRAAVPSIDEAVQYFSSKGYAPGEIDMTGPPPYRYTPFPTNQSTKKGG